VGRPGCPWSTGTLGLEAADLAEIYLEDRLEDGDRPHHIPEEIREPVLVLAFFAADRRPT